MSFQNLGLRDQLARHKMNELKPFAKANGIKPGKLRKTELVDALHEKISKDRAKAKKGNDENEDIS